MHQPSPTRAAPLAAPEPRQARSSRIEAPPFLENLFRRSLPREHGFEPLRVDGRLPDDLSGTLYRNGPGLFELFGRRYAHPFDGDGVVSSVRFRAGRAFGAARVVETAGLLAERRAGTVLYGGAAPWWRRMRNAHLGPDKVTANTSVLAWQGRLLALNEGGGPVELDPDTLDTIGETDLEGTVTTPFSAHPHRVAARGATYNVGLQYGAENRLHLFELPDVGAPRTLGSIVLREATMVHDFAATETHLVFFVSPSRLRLSRYLLQLGDFGSWFGWFPEKGTEIIVVSIDRPDRVVRFTVEPFFQWHFANAFSRGREIVVDYVRYPDFSPFLDLRVQASTVPLAGARYHRAVIDPERQAFSSTPLGDFGCEFPRVHPGIEGRDHRTSWLTRADTRAIVRLDVRTARVIEYVLPPGQWASEPVFVPRRGAAAGDELDGYVLALCHDEATDAGFVAVFDARRLEEGPCARVWFDHYVPVTFHGVWVDA